MGCPGLEPGTNRLKAEYSTIELATLKRYRGIEPLASVWKTEVLPLYEYRDGFTNEFYAGNNLLSSVYEKPGHHQEASQLLLFARLALQVLIDIVLVEIWWALGPLYRQELQTGDRSLFTKEPLLFLNRKGDNCRELRKLGERRDLNPRIMESQSSALPLGYARH